MLGLRKGGEAKKHDVEHNTKRPNVTGTRITATPDDLRGSVIRSPEGLVEELVSLDLGRETEVRDLDGPLGRQFINQQVFWLRGRGTRAGKAPGWGNKRSDEADNKEVHRLRVSTGIDKTNYSPAATTSHAPPTVFEQLETHRLRPPLNHRSHTYHIDRKPHPAEQSDTHTGS